MKRHKLVFVLFVAVTSIFPLMQTIEADPTSTGWGEPEIINSLIYGNANSPYIAMADSGEAMCVWIQSDSFRTNIWANRFVPGSGWGIPELIELDNTGWASWPHVSMNAAGDAVAVWVQSDGSYYRIWSNLYIRGKGWGIAEIIEMNDGNAMTPKVSMDPAGNAVAVWYQHDGSWNSIWANRYTNGIGWGTPVLLENRNNGNAMRVDVDTDRYGNALAVWIQHSNGKDDVYSSRYTTGASWSPDQLIEQNDEGSAGSPRIVMSPSGSAVAVWVQDDGARNNVWSNVYSFPGGWGTPVLIETDNSGGASNPDLSMNGWGDTIAVWDQSDGIRTNIWANTFSFGAGWSTAELVENVDDGSMRSPQVALDPQGNAIAVWNQAQPSLWNTWSNRYIAGEGWGEPEMIEAYNVANAEVPIVASDAAGNAIAVWSQSDSERENIISNRFAAPDTTPPMLAVDHPWEGSVSKNSTVIFSGMTEPGAAVYVGGIQAYMNEYGVFSLPIPLRPGRNDVQVISVDASGNSVSVTRTVFYEDPIEGLVSRIVDIDNEMDTIKGALEELENRTHVLEENFTEIGDGSLEVASLLENLTMLKGTVGVLNEELEQLRGEFDSLNCTCGESTLVLLNQSISDLGSAVQGCVEDIDDLETEVNEMKGTADVEKDVKDLERKNDLLIVTVFISLLFSLISIVAVIVIISKRKLPVEE